MKKSYLLVFGLMSTLVVFPAFSEGVSSAFRVSVRNVERDAATATRIGSILHYVDQADADAPKLRGLHETQLFEKTAPAVVLIFSLDANDQPNGLGSGSVIDANGRILTNVHVIEGADRVAVVFKPRTGGVKLGDINRADLYTATVEKVDAGRDLALLKLEHRPNSLVTLALGDLNAVAVGADVHAIGHPEGATWSYTKGIVSQIREDAEWSYSDEKRKHHATVIQTQTPINPGNSGGPLINDAMQLVGVNTYSRGDAQGMNYAVSVDDVKRFIAEPAQALPSRTSQAKSGAGEGKPGAKVGAPEQATEPGGKGKSSGGQPPSTAAEGQRCELRYGAKVRVAAQRAWRTEVDYNCSGTFNSYMLTWDDQTQGQALFIDRNGDGKVDAAYYDRDSNGKPETAEFDSHQSGTLDVRVQLDEKSGEVVSSKYL